MTDAPRDIAAGFNIFISYARDDEGFASELEAGLKLVGFDVFIDRQLSGGEEWWKSLRQRIEQADTIVFILTPDSAGSAMCLKELDEAVWLSKRVIPVVPVQLGEARIPERLSELQYVFFTPDRSFVAALSELRDALEKNLDWIQEHTRYSDMARRWKDGGKDESLLLTGQSLSEAKTWQKAWARPNPEPTVEIVEYIGQSESVEAIRLDQERQELAERERLAREAADASRRLTRGLIVFSVVAVMLAAAAGGAWYYARQQRIYAEAQTKRAENEADKAKKAERLAEAEAKKARAAEQHAENVAEEAKKNKELAEKEAIRAKTAEERASRVLKALLENLDTSWPDDKESSDYRHLASLPIAKELTGQTFTVDQTAIEKLLELNFFDPQAMGSKIIVGLRGATIDGMQLNKTKLELRDTRPDYKTFRTVFIVLDRNTGLMSAFVGSSVPALRYVQRGIVRYFTNEEFLGVNLLPAGMYLYRKNAHNRGRVKPALRLTDRGNAKADGPVTVLRTKSNFQFGLDDWWHRTMPYDNLHVSYLSDTFSSAGSLTIRGKTVDDLDYKEFANILRQVRWDTPVDICLLTGLEAAIAAKMVASPPATPEPQVDLRRLRQGSSGEFVKKLQIALGYSGKTKFFGPATAERLARLQKEKLGWADGIYSPEMDDLLGLGVFKGRTSTEPPPPETGEPEDDLPETVAIREEDLLRFMPRAKAGYREAFLKYGPEILGRHGITADPLRFSHFMAQVAHESGGFTIDTESLDYRTPQRLVQVWPSVFPTIAAAKPFVRNEKKLADAVYGGRFGNAEPDDGYRFRGRGLIMITGRDAYESVNPLLGEDTDIVKDPDLAADPAVAIEIAAILWTQLELNKVADRNKIEIITLRVNGGYTGLASRRASFQRAWAIWGDGQPPRPRTTDGGSPQP